ncbi:uncharacterized protein LOC143146616 isoform X3 [Ptiloglossa arizonensis]|uniref:uncharacterized protein LOC143146616 isoform X3 n=1 Tax=Ptiloglossa arizonensis TaxID=3350558 RepID=UPI003FA07B28
MLTEDKKKFWSNEDLRSFPLPSDRIAEDQIVARLTHLNVGITNVLLHPSSPGLQSSPHFGKHWVGR